MGLARAQHRIGHRQRGEALVDDPGERPDVGPRQVALELVYDRRRYDDSGALTYDPLARFLDLFEGVDAAAIRADRAAELMALPLGERLARRIIDGEAKGLPADLDQALGEGRPALDIINDHLLDGMRTVGELFGRGEMQLPFVLASAEVMKTAVAHLEPHIPADDAGEGKGTIVLATVKGDVHDIGKNLVDIVLSNNGFQVVNLGIKVPSEQLIQAVEQHRPDVIGLSGLLVKSAQQMVVTAGDLSAVGIDTPLLVGGAALTRRFTHRKIAASITPHEAFPVGGSVPGVRVGPGCVQGGTGFRIGSGAASLEVCGRF